MRRWRRWRRAVERGEQVETEGLAGERREREDAAAVVAHALEALPDHQADAARHLGVGDLDARAPPARLVEELSRLVEMAEHLLHEERIALGLRVDERHQLG